MTEGKSERVFKFYEIIIVTDCTLPQPALIPSSLIWTSEGSTEGPLGLGKTSVVKQITSFFFFFFNGMFF